MPWSDVNLIRTTCAPICMALDYCAQAGLAYWRFRSGKWRKTRV